MPRNFTSPNCASVDLELFFATKAEQKKHAIAVCQTCPHLEECREIGKEMEYGIWGGVERKPLTEKERIAQNKGVREVLEQAVRDMHAAGYRVVEIARTLEIGHSRVKFILDKDKESSGAA
jgi:hypothetical protein